jgi:hypothetical protein
MTRAGHARPETLVIHPLQIWQDLWNLSRGSCAFVRWLAERDPLEIGLAVFSAEAPTATRGVQSAYAVRIASAAGAPRSVKLLMDFYALNAPPGTDGHYAYFSRTLRIPPRVATTVDIRYDWERTVCFTCEGLATEPDDLWWRGAQGLPQLYAVYALLYDLAGAELDRLVISQELCG